MDSKKLTKEFQAYFSTYSQEIGILDETDTSAILYGSDEFKFDANKKGQIYLPDIGWIQFEETEGFSSKKVSWVGVVTDGYDFDLVIGHKGVKPYSEEVKHQLPQKNGYAIAVPHSVQKMMIEQLSGG